VTALRQVWVQQYYRHYGEHGEQVLRRESKEHGLPPGRLTLVSPYDLDARYSEKRGTGRVGYKVHLSETCHEPAPEGTRAAPNLLTNVATTAATTPDAAMTETIHDTLGAKGLTPAEHATDAGYACADITLAARARGITPVGPFVASPTATASHGVEPRQVPPWRGFGGDWRTVRSRPRTVRRVWPGDCARKAANRAALAEGSSPDRVGLIGVAA